MATIKIVTARITDAGGAEGLGAPFTRGVNGGAAADILGREMPDLVAGEDADRIERIWKELWWAFHLPVTSHGAQDIAAHLLAACPNRSYLETQGFGLGSDIEEPARIEDGDALAPDRPCPGVIFKWDRRDAIRSHSAIGPGSVQDNRC